MANTDNLKRGNPETQFKSGQKAVENGRKGGIASGKAKRRKADMQQAAQDIINGDYTTKGGQVLSGDQVILHKVMEVATNPDHKNWAKAVDLLVSLTAKEKKTSKDRLVDMQIKLLQAKIDALTNIKNADRHDGKLADLIEGLMVTDDIHEETATVNGTVAEQETEKNKHS